MTDISEYTTYKQQATDLYQALKDVRLKIHAIEERMIQEMQQTQQSMMVVVSDNQQAVIKLQGRTRRIPLSEEDLKARLQECLQAQFGNVDPHKIVEFSASIAHKIWSERRVKEFHRVVVKMG